VKVPATEVFEFLERQRQFAHKRLEFVHEQFDSFRRAIRALTVRLYECEEQGRETAIRLGATLCEALTVPIAFSSLPKALFEVGGRLESFGYRFGSQLAELYDHALVSADNLSGLENPLRLNIGKCIADRQSAGESFKIFCHRRAKAHFESLLSEQAQPSLPDHVFLHSARDYRDTTPFQVILKVGPLRSAGWSMAPDALLSAPRFEMMLQFVWNGCVDEPGFGFDPADLASEKSAAGSPVRPPSGPKRWVHQTTIHGDNSPLKGTAEEFLDEFKLIENVQSSHDARLSTLIEMDGQEAMLFPRYAHVLSFDPNPASREPVERRIPADSLEEGMFLIDSLLHEIDLGAVKADHGEYSRIWKDALRVAWQDDAAGLLAKLRIDGLSLNGLSSAIVRWCRPPSTVIHAPQETKHFEILLRVLRSNGAKWPVDETARIQFWRLAWNEIRRSRGDAIQAGFQEHDFLEEEILTILRGQVEKIRELARDVDSFALDLLADQTVSGTLRFSRVKRIEEGFLSPESWLKIRIAVGEFDRWRV
jgi:hypothetical protein